MENQAKIELTDPTEIEDFKKWCQHKQEMIAEDDSWRQVKKIAKKIAFGSFNVTIKEGKPVRIDNAIQTFLIVI